jgi:hypothetical protein
MAAQTVTPQQACCGVKPVYTDPAYAPFTGQVAVVTYEQIAGFNDVLRIIDLSGVTSTTPLNTKYLAPKYIHPTWTAARFGAIFGVTLDDSGNIYVAATTIYSTKAVGTGGTHGTIYKIANGTGAVTNLVSLPSSLTGTLNPAGLGNIAYDCDTHTLFASDLDNGLIYQLNPNTGAILAIWNHGVHLSPPIADDPTKTYTQVGRRVWGLRASNGKLLYAAWNENPGETSATKANEIWSVTLNSTVGFVPGSHKLEITLPPFPPGTGTPSSNPVAGINVGPGGNLLLSERSVITNTGSGTISPGAHQSRVLEYAPGLTWTPMPTGKFGISVQTPPTSSTGASDYDFTPGATMGLWAMADALQFVPDVLYGLQGLPSSGGSIATSVLIDVSGTTTAVDKTTLGSVDLPCPRCGSPVGVAISGLGSACQSPSSYCANGPPGSSFSWTVTGGTFTVTSANCINVSWNLIGPYMVTVTATEPNGCRITARRQVTPCPALCCPVPVKADLKSIKAIAGGNYTVTAALTGPPGNIKRITATVVSATRQFFPASCGAAGPVAVTIASAPAQNGFLSFLPPFSRQATWTHPTTGAPVSNLNFTFDLGNLPPFPSGDCTDQIQFCVRWEFTTIDCHTCEVTTCWRINRGIPLADTASPTAIE